MGKLIYITESQLQEIISNGTYLNKNDSTNEYRFGSTQVSTNGITGDYVDGNLEMGKPTTSDKIAKQITRNKVRGMGRTVLPESNQDLTGKQNTFQLSTNVVNRLKKKLNNYNGDKNDAGFKRANRLIDRGRISYDNAYRVLNDINSGKAGELIDGDHYIKNELENKVKTGENISQNKRDGKMKRGEKILNVTSRNSFNGKGHSSKPNIIGINYEN